MKLFKSIISVVFLSTLGYSQSISTATINTSANIEDSYTFLGSPNSNNGNLANITVGVNSSLQYYRGFLKFNLTTIPAGAVIVSAKLSLAPSGTENITAPTSTQLTLQLCNSFWDESVTHNLGITNNTLQTSVDTSTLVSARREFNVKNHVQALVDGRIPNFGWRLRRSVETASTPLTNYFSENSPNALNNPKLVIQYYEPISVSSATIVHASSIQNTDASISPVLIKGSSSTKTYTWYNSAGTVIATTLNLANVGYGWYGLRVLGTDAADVMYYAFIVGVQCESVNITFNPNGNYVDDAMYYDLVVGSGNTAIKYNENNFGNYNWLTSQYTTFSSVWHKYRSLMKFRLWIDPTMNITTANMNLTGDGHLIGTEGMSNAAEFRRVETTWKETGVSDLNKPTNSNAILVTVPSTTSTNQNAVVDLSSFFNYWKTVNATNNGMLFQLTSFPTSNNYLKHTYMSSDYTTKPTVNFSVNLISESCNMTGYSELKRVLDAGYVKTFQGRLRFVFDEEYQIPSGKFISYKIYDLNYTNVFSCDLNGNLSQTVSNPNNVKLPYKFDDNVCELNFSGILTLNQYYTLEVTTSTGEKKYLRFHYAN